MDNEKLFNTIMHEAKEEVANRYVKDSFEDAQNYMSGYLNLVISIEQQGLITFDQYQQVTDYLESIGAEL